MSHFKKALEEGEKLFDKEFDEPFAQWEKSAVQSYLTQFAEKIRQAVAEDDVEWVKSMIKTEDELHKDCMDYDNDYTYCKAKDYNDALTEIITHKREQLTKE